LKTSFPKTFKRPTKHLLSTVKKPSKAFRTLSKKRTIVKEPLKHIQKTFNKPSINVQKHFQNNFRKPSKHF
jgi:hypothetical protein